MLIGILLVYTGLCTFFYHMFNIVLTTYKTYIYSFFLNNEFVFFLAQQMTNSLSQFG